MTEIIHTDAVVQEGNTVSILPEHGSKRYMVTLRPVEQKALAKYLDDNCISLSVLVRQTLKKAGYI